MGGMFDGMGPDEWDAEYTNYRFDAPNVYLVSIVAVKKTDDGNYFIIETELIAKKAGEGISPEPGDKISHVIPLNLKPRYMGISRKKIKAFMVAGFGAEALCESYELENIRDIDQDALEELAEQVLEENVFEGAVFRVESKVQYDKETREEKDFPDVRWYSATEEDYEEFGVTD